MKVGEKPTEHAMRIIPFFAALLLAPVAFLHAADSTPAQRPNIL
jgi:hypothetical protein